MRANGFTLIELLVALVVGGLLLSGMSWAVSRLTRDVRSEERRSDRQHITIIGNTLTTLIGAARLTPEQPVELSDRELTLRTNPPLSFGPVGLVEARLKVDGRFGHENLVIGFRDGSGRTTGPASGSGLLRDMRSIRFSWLDDRAPEETSSPAVQIAVLDQAREETKIIVPIVVTGDAACQFDPISMACR